MSKVIRSFLLAFVMVGLLSVPAYSASIKIGYVNLQKALNLSESGKQAKDFLQKEAQEKEDEIDGKQEELKKMKEEIDEKSSVWNDETLKKKQNEFIEKSKVLQKQFVEYGKELNKQKQKTEEQIIDELGQIVEQVASKRKYDYIFERSVGGLLVVPDEGDITDEVIELHNEKFHKEK